MQTCPHGNTYAVTVICGFILSLLGACHSASPYPVIDSRLFVLPSMTRFYWIDNSKLIFGGYEASTTRVNGRPNHYGVYIWDTASNTFVRHADWGSDAGVPVLCFNDGYVFYSVNLVAKYGHPELNDVRAGALGSETRIPPIAGAYEEDLRRCKGYPRQRPNTPPDTLIYELRPQDGYIFVAQNKSEKGMPVTASNMNDPVKLYRPGESQPKVLPVLAKEMNLDNLTYSEYADKYILAPLAWRTKLPGDPTWPPPAGTKMRIYLISPDGGVDTIEIPPGTYPASAVAPTHAGMFWTSFDTGSFGPVTGTWLLKNGRLKKLFNTGLGSAAVSPDGCKLAYFNSGNATYSPTAKVMNFCGSQE